LCSSFIDIIEFHTSEANSSMGLTSTNVARRVTFVTIKNLCVQDVSGGGGELGRSMNSSKLGKQPRRTVVDGEREK
jgi:hypothetical protein